MPIKSIRKWHATCTHYLWTYAYKLLYINQIYKLLWCLYGAYIFVYIIEVKYNICILYFTSIMHREIYAPYKTLSLQIYTTKNIHFCIEYHNFWLWWSIKEIYFKSFTAGINYSVCTLYIYNYEWQLSL